MKVAEALAHRLLTRTKTVDEIVTLRYLDQAPNSLRPLQSKRNSDHSHSSSSSSRQHNQEARECHRYPVRSNSNRHQPIPRVFLSRSANEKKKSRRRLSSQRLRIRKASMHRLPRR